MEFFHPTFTWFWGVPRCNSGQICIILKPQWGRIPFLNHSFTVTSAEVGAICTGNCGKISISPLSHLHQRSFLIAALGPVDFDSYPLWKGWLLRRGDLYPNHQPFKSPIKLLVETLLPKHWTCWWFPQNLPSGSPNLPKRNPHLWRKSRVAWLELVELNVPNRCEKDRSQALRCALGLELLGAKLSFFPFNQGINSSTQ